jgi:hypothetical protein
MLSLMARAAGKSIHDKVITPTSQADCRVKPYCSAARLVCKNAQIVLNGKR